MGNSRNGALPTIGQLHILADMIDQSLDSALAAYLELLAAATQPDFDWGPAELRAAFQWADTMQQLVDSADGSAAVQTRLQVRPPPRPPLPPLLHTLLAACLACTLTQSASACKCTGAVLNHANHPCRCCDPGSQQLCRQHCQQRPSALCSSWWSASWRALHQAQPQQHLNPEPQQIPQSPLTAVGWGRWWEPM